VMSGRKVRKVYFEAEIDMPDSVQKITLSKDGRILIFYDEPCLSGLGDWSNRHMNFGRITVLNHEDVKISVK